MSTLVESLKRLYQRGKITDEKLNSMQTEGKITAEEQQYIKSGSTESDLQTYYNKTQSILPGGGSI